MAILSPNPTFRLIRHSMHCLRLGVCLAASIFLIGVQSSVAAQSDKLPKDHYKSGSAILKSLTPISETTRRSIVKLDVNGNTVALATIIDVSGLALTKASEIKQGRLTAWLSGGREVPATLLRTDVENDLALVQINASGLQPVAWSTADTAVGQWAVTPGIENTPQAVGIISVPPRKILHKRALIGVQLDFTATTAKVLAVIPGMGAEKAGLKPDDVILSVNGIPVKDSESLVTTLRPFREGQTVRLQIQRKDKRVDAQVAMKTPPPEDAGSSPRGFRRMGFSGTGRSERAEGFEQVIQHDTVLQPWQCGGPLVNLDGKAVGINIARAGRVATYALPSSLVLQILQRLRSP